MNQHGKLSKHGLIRLTEVTYDRSYIYYFGDVGNWLDGMESIKLDIGDL